VNLGFELIYLCSKKRNPFTTKPVRPNGRIPEVPHKGHKEVGCGMYQVPNTQHTPRLRLAKPGPGTKNQVPGTQLNSTKNENNSIYKIENIEIRIIILNCCSSEQSGGSEINR
jgi:hypothetical protein